MEYTDFYYRNDGETLDAIERENFYAHLSEDPMMEDEDLNDIERFETETD